jgi:osmoprotectant transport system permease protein
MALRDAPPVDDQELAEEPEQGPEGRRRLLRRQEGSESKVMLFLLPVLVALVFAGYVWWRQAAHLDAIEESALNWQKVGSQALQHVELTVVSSLVTVLVAIPLGIAVTRGPLRKVAPAVTILANAGQSAPSIGLIVLLAMWWGFSFWTAVWALTLYAILPVLRNTITGLQGVDPTLVEAGRGIGMSAPTVLLRIELPLALPVIMAGVRTALVLVVGTAALATFINAGGLGGTLYSGITLYRFPVIVSAAVLIALLALLVEWVGRVLEVVFRPKGI